MKIGWISIAKFLNDGRMVLVILMRSYQFDLLIFTFWTRMLNSCDAGKTSAMLQDA